MRCYYEVLGVERNAEADVLKKSFYKMSLKLHPDKNPDRVAEVTPLYQEVVEAYKVLSDPQERAWYDKHRDQILMGGMGMGDYEEERLDVYQYFTTSCFSGYDDDEKGFYTIYRNVFDNIAEEEYRAMFEKEADFDMPGFGSSTSEYESVVGPFYVYWETFSSQKSYAWVEKFDTRQAPGRKVRRAMEAENKKLRDQAKRERNEEVRELVAYVKKRDKRVKERREELARKAEASTAKARKKAVEARKRAAAELAEEMARGEPEWASMDGLEKELARLEAQWDKENGIVLSEEDEEPSENDGAAGDDDNVEEEVADGLFCPACNKVFRSDQAFANHENSKKHRTRVALLRQELLAEEGAIEDDLEEGDETLDSLVAVESGVGKSKRSKKNKRKQRRQQIAEDDDDEEVDAEEIVKDVEGQKNDIEEKEQPKDSAVAVDERENDIEEKEQTEHTAEVDVPESAYSANAPRKTSLEHSNKTSSETYKCQICTKCFPTRNKLFTHIRETGHAALKETDNVPVEEKNPSQRKKARRNKNK